MIEKWVIFKRDYLEISFLRENCGYDGSDERRRSIKAYLCRNIINFDSVDFSERRPEETVRSFF